MTAAQKTASIKANAKPKAESNPAPAKRKTKSRRSPAPEMPAVKGSVSAARPCISMDKPAPDQILIRRSLTADGICLLTFDHPASSANIFSEQALTELSSHLDWIEKQNHHDLRALVIESAKDSIFVAGADIQTLQSAGPDDLNRFLELGQTVFNRLADISIPTVAAIHGASMGGGFEVALACDYRVASSDKATKIALPEVLLGIIPAWGGCTRLPRLIGLQPALDLILTGKKLSAHSAKKRGVVDSVAPREYLLASARTLIQHGKARRPRHWLRNNRVAAEITRAIVRPKLLKKTRGNYPAVFKALDVVTASVHLDRPEALALERSAVLTLAAHPAAANLIRTFFLQQRARKLTFKSPSAKEGSFAAPAFAARKLCGQVPNAPLKRAAVIGAGAMGAGIAHWLSSRNYRVILQDIAPNAVAGGLTSISKRYGEAVKRRIFTENEARRLQDNISPAAQPVSLTNCGLVIEAATENLETKKAIFAGLEKRTGKDTILATNTSALPIKAISSGLKHPERVIGIHFFNPVHRMQLVEIVVPGTADPGVVESIVSFVQNIGKLPVIVSDTPGFLVNRVLMPYLIEAGHLYARGVPAKQIDDAMLDFGMPMGPLRLLDEIGLDVALDVARTLSAAFPDRMDIPSVLESLVEQGYLGKKTGRGFYNHAAENATEAGRLQPDAPSASLSTLDLQNRMSFVMINEAARCLDEAVAGAPEDVDFAMIMGTGFAPFRGGPLRYADSLGAAAIVSALKDFANQTQSDTGIPACDRFAPSPRLAQMAEKNLTFYPTT